MGDLLAAGAAFAAGVALAVALGTRLELLGLRRRFDLLLRGLDLDLTDHLKLSDGVKELARDPARKIEAIRAYREETGAGLADAKAAVELYLASLKT